MKILAWAFTETSKNFIPISNSVTFHWNHHESQSYWLDGAPGWLSWLSLRLWLRPWSHSLWVWAPCGALCWQFRAQSLLWILCLPLSLPHPCSHSVSLSLSKIDIKKIFLGVPGWLSRLSGRLRLRSWSHSSWVGAPHQALCWQLGAWSLLWTLCLSLSLCPSPAHSLSLKNKH